MRKGRVGCSILQRPAVGRSRNKAELERGCQNNNILSSHLFSAQLTPVRFSSLIDSRIDFNFDIMQI